MKKIIYNKEAKEKIKDGIDLVANAVKTTLGPSGKYVVIGKSFGPPITTKDGVTVAKSISSTNLSVNIGCELIKQVADRQLKTSGDGTTTATIIAQELINNVLKLEDINPRKVREQFKEITEKIVSEVDSLTKQIESDEDLKNIAIISTNGDKELGNYVYEAVKVSGVNGSILVEDSKNSETKVISYPGYMFERGYISHHFSGTNSECKLHDVKILMTDDEIKDWSEIRNICEDVFARRDELLIICKDMSENALRNLILNTQQGRLRSCVVKLPALRNRGEILLEDIAIKTNGVVISPKNQGHVFNKVKVEHLGSCDSVTIDKDITVIIGGKGDSKKIEERESQIKSDIQKANTLELPLQEERMAKFIGGVSVIHVGANSDSELAEKKARIDDAVRATKEALKFGIVPGGGATLNYISNKISCKPAETFKFKVLEALSKPLEVIAENTNSVFKFDNTFKTVYDYNLDTYVDSYKGGLIDPASIVKNAVINAVSLSSLVLCTDAVIYPADYDVEQAVMEGIEHGKNRY